MENPCPPGKIRNPATGRCVSKNGAIGKRLQRGNQPVEQPRENRNKNECPPGKVRNPATGRCVNVRGAIGRNIIECPPGTRMNPVNGRCVKEKSSIREELSSEKHTRNSKAKRAEKDCPPGTIRNPATGKCVKENGPIGRRLRGENIDEDYNDKVQIYDYIQMQDVPIKTFLDQEGCFVIKDGKHFHGANINAVDWIYECVDGVPYRDYKRKVKPIIRIPAGTAKYHIYRDELLKVLNKKHNFLTIKTEKRKFRYLSREFLRTMDATSRDHCDATKLISISKITSNKKKGKGLVMSKETRKILN